MQDKVSIITPSWNSEKYIKVYISLYFYDDVNNNIDKDCEKDKYWNDTWIITYKINGGKTKDNCNCSNCGSVMKYNLQNPYARSD